MELGKTFLQVLLVALPDVKFSRAVEALEKQSRSASARFWKKWILNQESVMVMSNLGSDPIKLIFSAIYSTLDFFYQPEKPKLVTWLVEFQRRVKFYAEFCL